MAKKREPTALPRDAGRATKKENADRPKVEVVAQGKAFEYAREQAKREKIEVVTHRTDGRIRNSGMYDNVPIPPREKMH